MDMKGSPFITGMEIS